MGAITTRLSVLNDLSENEWNKLSIAGTGYLFVIWLGVVVRAHANTALCAAILRRADYRKSGPTAHLEITLTQALQ
tara:strand:- start:26 stop:253 length:228 start_codon:yes stop_codon:yes gene_type:complete